MENIIIDEETIEEVEVKDEKKFETFKNKAKAVMKSKPAQVICKAVTCLGIGAMTAVGTCLGMSLGSKILSASTSKNNVPDSNEPEAVSEEN